MVFKFGVRENHIEIFKKSGRAFQKKVSQPWIGTRWLWWINVQYDLLNHCGCLCSFRLVLEGETGKEIPESSRLQFLERFLGNNFVLSDAQDNTFGSLIRGVIPGLPLLRTLLVIHLKSWEPGLLELMDSFVLVAYASLAASRTLLQWLLACLNFTLDSADLFCWYKEKKWFLWTMVAAQAAENHRDEWDLTWYLRWGIYTSISTWTHEIY